jgi:outer membrane protein TolC
VLVALLVCPLASGCVVGPSLHKTRRRHATCVQRAPAADRAGGATWNVAQPADETVRGGWWEVFGDPQLNALEQQIDMSNQNVAAAMADFSRLAPSRAARSHLSPTLSTNPTILRPTSRQ